MERNLEGRCGTCGFFVRLRTDSTGASTGECRLGCWPSPLRDAATCPSYKRVGASFEGALKRKAVAGAPRAYRGDSPGQDAREQRPPIPEEIGIDMDQDEFRQVLREVLLDELGVRDVEMGERWRGGELVIKPGKPGTQEKSVPLDVFFKKIVMVRDKLRVLEQKLNAHSGLAQDEKVQLQQYITGCYGTLTTFNVLFKERDDQFIGQKED
jgi:hypothetical protein